MTDQHVPLDAALERVIEAARAHLAAVKAAEGRVDDDDVWQAYVELNNASFEYDELLLDAFGEVTPWDVESIDPDEADERFGVGLGGVDGNEPADPHPQVISVRQRRDYRVPSVAALVRVAEAARRAAAAGRRGRVRAGGVGRRGGAGAAAGRRRLAGRARHPGAGAARRRGDGHRGQRRARPGGVRRRRRRRPVPPGPRTTGWSTGSTSTRTWTLELAGSEPTSDDGRAGRTRRADSVREARLRLGDDAAAEHHLPRAVAEQPHPGQLPAGELRLDRQSAPRRSTGRHLVVTAAARIRSPWTYILPLPPSADTTTRTSLLQLRVAERQRGHVVERRAISRRQGRSPPPAARPAAARRVRAPRIGATTPGRSRTQASATSSGDDAEPVGGGDDRLDDAGAARLQVRRDEPLEVRRRGPRVGRPAVAVLAGEHPAARAATRAARPSPSAGAGGQHLALDAALQQRVLHLGGDQRGPARPGGLPGGGAGGLPAGEVGHPDVADLAGWRPRGPAR